MTVPRGRRSSGQATPKRRLSTLLQFGFSIGLVAAAATTLYLEARPYFISGIPVPVRVAAITSGELRPGPSFDSQRFVLDDCYVAMDSLYARVAPTTERLRLLQQCASLAARITEAAPTSAYAHLVQAIAAAALGDAAGLNAGLAQSQRLAPREGWLAEARATFAETQLGRLDAAAGAGQAADLGTLAASTRYSGPIVARYIDDPQFRERLAAILAQLPEADQRRFLSLTSAALKARGS